MAQIARYEFSMPFESRKAELGETKNTCTLIGRQSCSFGGQPQLAA